MDPLQTINVGAAANDGTGDPLRVAAQKANANFSVIALNDTQGTTTLTGEKIWDGGLAEDVNFNDIATLTLDSTILNASGVESVSIASTGVGAGQGQVEIRADQQLTILTPAVVAQTATVGQFLKLTDAVNGVVEFATATGGGGSNSYDVWAGDIIPAITNGPSSNTSETTTNKVGYDTVDFDQGTEESATVLVRTPTGWTGSTFTASVTWTADSGTGGVVWGISARLLANDDPIDSAFGTEVTSTDTLIATGDLHESPTTAAITPGGTAAASRVMVLKLARKTGNGSDTLTADARMIGLRIYW